MLSRVHLRSKCSYGWRIYYRFHGNEYFRGTTTRDKKGWKLIDRIRRSKDRVDFLFRRFRNMGIAREVCNVAVTRSASASSGRGGRGNTMARLRVFACCCTNFQRISKEIRGTRIRTIDGSKILSRHVSNVQCAPRE